MPVSRKRRKKTGEGAALKSGGHGGVGGTAMSALTLAGLAVALGGLTWLIMGGASDDQTVTVNVPRLSAKAALGRAAFNSICANCHGIDGSGSNLGPPLIHSTYRPGHHGDGSFLRAVVNGVNQHHWRFGDMPPQPDAGAERIDAIIAFLRETQRANGIF